MIRIRLQRLKLVEDFGPSQLEHQVPPTSSTDDKSVPTPRN